MSEEERRALLEKMQASAAEARRLTQEQAKQRLAEEGFFDAQGELSAQYGGGEKQVRR